MLKYAIPGRENLGAHVVNVTCRNHGAGNRLSDVDHQICSCAGAGASAPTQSKKQRNTHIENPVDLMVTRMNFARLLFPQGCTGHEKLCRRGLCALIWSGLCGVYLCVCVCARCLVCVCVCVVCGVWCVMSGVWFVVCGVVWCGVVWCVCVTWCVVYGVWRVCSCSCACYFLFSGGAQEKTRTPQLGCGGNVFGSSRRAAYGIGCHPFTIKVLLLYLFSF